MGRGHIKAKNQEIVDYWFARVDESELDEDEDQGLNPTTERE